MTQSWVQYSQVAIKKNHQYRQCEAWLCCDEVYKIRKNVILIAFPMFVFFYNTLLYFSIFVFEPFSKKCDI